MRSPLENRQSTSRRGLSPEGHRFCGEEEEDELEEETEQHTEKQNESQQSVGLFDSKEHLEQIEDVRPHEFGKKLRLRIDKIEIH